LSSAKPAAASFTCPAIDPITHNPREPPGLTQWFPHANSGRGKKYTLYIPSDVVENTPSAVGLLDGGRFFCAESKRETHAMSERVPMTRAGYNKIKAELYVLENEQMPEIEKRIATARAEGDLSENAEYHGARESQGMLQAKINVLRDKLARATIMDTSKVSKDQVAFGCTIVVKDLDFGDNEEFTLVGAGEEDYDTGRINIASPLAQGFVGKKIGDRVEVTVPAGTNKFEILEIRFEEE
jgi:transcription elongation factor GreA